MDKTQTRRKLIVLVAGDLVVLILVTLAGFATHGELGSAWMRMLATFFPLTIAWFLVAPFLGVYDRALLVSGRNLWRPFYAMILAAPMAALLRAALLGMAIIVPIFVVVLGGISALAIAAWRALYWLIFYRKSPTHG